MIQVRNVRPELHAELVRRAQLRGTTLTAYIEEILEREVSAPEADEAFLAVQRRRRGRRTRASSAEIAAIVRDIRGPLPGHA